MATATKPRTKKRKAAPAKRKAQRTKAAAAAATPSTNGHAKAAKPPATKVAGSKDDDAQQVFDGFENPKIKPLDALVKKYRAAEKTIAAQKVIKDDLLPKIEAMCRKHQLLRYISPHGDVNIAEGVTIVKVRPHKDK